MSTVDQAISINDVNTIYIDSELKYTRKTKQIQTSITINYIFQALCTLFFAFGCIYLRNDERLFFPIFFMLISNVALYAKVVFVSLNVSFEHYLSFHEYIRLSVASFIIKVCCVIYWVLLPSELFVDFYRIVISITFISMIVSPIFHLLTEILILLIMNNKMNYDLEAYLPFVNQS